MIIALTQKMADKSISLPQAVERVFGVAPGLRPWADVTADRIEILKNIPFFVSV